VKETRSVQCKDCHWSQTVGEVAWQGDPKVTLRGVIEEARLLRPKDGGKRA
jgi:hypothetical protein